MRFSRVHLALLTSFLPLSCRDLVRPNPTNPVLPDARLQDAASATTARAPIVYVAGGSLTLINSATNEVLGVIPGGGAWDIVATADGLVAYVSDARLGVGVVRGRSSVGLIRAGSKPTGLAMTTDEAFVWAADGGSDQVSVIETSSNTVIETIQVGAVPFDVELSPDDAFAYVANAGDGTVSIVDTRSRVVVATVPVGRAPHSLSVTPDGEFIYITNEAIHTVTVLDAATRTVAATIQVQGRPQGLEMTPDGRFVYVANNGSGHESVIETATNAVVASTAVGPLSSRPEDVAFTPNGVFAYVTTEHAGLFVLDVATHTVVDNIPLRDGGGAITIPPASPAPLPPGELVYVPLADRSVVQILDAATLNVVGGVFVGDEPVAAAFAPDGRVLYTANQTSWDVSVVDVASHTTLATLPLGDTPRGIALSPNGDVAYVATHTGQLQVWDTAVHNLITAIALSGAAVELAVTATGHKVYVALHNSDIDVIDTQTNSVTGTISVRRPVRLASTPDGAFVYGVGSGRVFIIDTSTDAIVTTFPLGFNPRDLAFTPDGAFLYVSDFNQNHTVWVVETATNTTVNALTFSARPARLDVSPDGAFLYVDVETQDNVHVIETATHSVVGTIAVGGRTGGFALPPPAASATSACALSFWRRNWAAWEDTDLRPRHRFNPTFGTDFLRQEVTLERAILGQVPREYRQIARAGTASLLNAHHPGVNFPFSAAEVIAAVRIGHAEALHPMVLAMETLGCPLASGG